MASAGSGPAHSSWDVGPMSGAFGVCERAGRNRPGPRRRSRRSTCGRLSPPGLGPRGPRLGHPYAYLASRSRSSGLHFPRTCGSSFESAPLGVLAGRVHPRWLSWGFRSRGALGPISAPRGLPRSLDRRPRIGSFHSSHPIRPTERCPPRRRLSMTPIQSLPPAGWVPVSRPMPSCGSLGGLSKGPLRVRFRASFPGVGAHEVLEDPRGCSRWVSL